MPQHFATIMAGGSGTRLWPMSRSVLPKQLIPFLGGKSLLEIALNRFDGLIPPERRYVCAGRQHRQAVLSAVPSLVASQFLGEPVGRDTLGAVGFSAAVLAQSDPHAIVGVFTADHLIEPVEEFQQIIAEGFALVQRHANCLVTFGVTPTGPATGYGYLELAEPLEGAARRVKQFREKPPREVAEQYIRQGPQRYLWNSGMFIWRAATLLDCIRRYQPAAWEGFRAIGEAWGTPQQEEVLDRVYPLLKKTSVDYAVMEPASRDPAVCVAALPMPLRWLDVGSWSSFAEARGRNAEGNALAAQRHLLVETADCLVASNDPQHLICAIGCRDLVIVHTPDATLICRADLAEKIKDVHQMVQSQFGNQHT